MIFPFLSAAEPTTLTGRAMGTTWSAKFFQPATPLEPAAVTAQIAARLEALEAIFSTYRPASALSRFNASLSTDWQPVAPELAQLALASRALSELTHGAYDVTVDPLVRLWGFGPERRSGASRPTAPEIAAARARVDYHRLEISLSPPALRKTSPTLTADFSSMAKGFASDELSALLTSLGAVDHLVQVAGDLRTAGTHSWHAGIENPAPPESSGSPFSALVMLTGQSLSTSGDARNFFTAAGQRYGHLIDPRTGRPATSTLASVSVIHVSCAQSSALATALFVLGPDAGFALATREHLACLFLLREADRLVQRTTPEFTWFQIQTPR